MDEMYQIGDLGCFKFDFQVKIKYKMELTSLPNYLLLNMKKFYKIFEGLKFSLDF